KPKMKKYAEAEGELASTWSGFDAFTLGQIDNIIAGEAAAGQLEPNKKLMVGVRDDELKKALQKNPAAKVDELFNKFKTHTETGAAAIVSQAQQRVAQLTA